jgi:hypothetical protein
MHLSVQRWYWLSPYLEKALETSRRHITDCTVKMFTPPHNKIQTFDIGMLQQSVLLLLHHPNVSKIRSVFINSRTRNLPVLNFEVSCPPTLFHYRNSHFL